MQDKFFEKPDLISSSGAFAKLFEIQSNIVAETHKSRTEDLIFSIFKSLKVKLLFLAAILKRTFDFSKAKLDWVSDLFGLNASVLNTYLVVEHKFKFTRKKMYLKNF